MPLPWTLPHNTDRLFLTDLKGIWRVIRFDRFRKVGFERREWRDALSPFNGSNGPERPERTKRVERVKMFACFCCLGI